MSARLACLAGPLIDNIFELDPAAGEVSLGRESSNAIELRDLQVSRAHAMLRPSSPGAWNIEDLGSSNGTFVNRRRVRSKALRSGDHLQLGDSVFLFLAEHNEGPGHASVQPDSQPLLDTVRFAEPPPPGEAALSLLLRFAGALRSWQSLEGLQSEILDLLTEQIPSRRAAVLLLDPGTATIESAWRRQREPGSSEIAVSSTVLRQVVETRSAMLARYGPGGDASPSESVKASGVDSVLAVPVLGRDSVDAVLYLDSDDPAAPFLPRHLELAGAVASFAAQPLDSARRIHRLEAEKRRLEADLGRKLDLIGDSAVMRQACAALLRAAPADTTVLILGETGAGKELAARALHENSRRAQGPFIAVNCAAIADNLLESEMFGHERGAFTGAIGQKRGKIELANNGTLFLDEIGELPLQLQAKLLRVLQEREFERVGGSTPVRVNFRLVAATNRNLQEMITEGRFRADLYFRLNVVAVKMPPLRARREDILPLASYFLDRMAAKASRSVHGFSPRARAALAAHDWPGNVRELQNAVERALVFGSSDWIELEDLPEEIVEMLPSSAAGAERYHAQVLESKRRILRAAVERADGRYTEAARALEINPKYLHRLLKAYGLKSD